MRIIHIIVDNKFIDGAISLFDEGCKSECAYAIYVTNTDAYKAEYVRYKNLLFINGDNALDVINSYDVVILHSLPCLPLDIIPQINPRVKVVWFAWGYDIYETPYNVIPVELFGPITRRHTFVLGKLNPRYYYEVMRAHHVLPKVISRIDYFSGVFSYEYDLIKENWKQFHALALDYYYGSSNFFIPEIPSQEISERRNNIIVGNSANPTNNHLEVFSFIKEAKLADNANIIVPLSYGGGMRYINAVEKEGFKLFGDKFKPLRTYMPLDEYLDLTSRCKTAIFFHYRQQASDNIFMQLINGARVFMSEKSKAYYYLRDLGLSVYTLENDIDKINQELEEGYVLENRRILSELYSSSKLIDRVSKIENLLSRE